MRVDEDGRLLCKVCGEYYSHLVATILAFDDDCYNLTKILVNGIYEIPVREVSYPYRSQGNIHLVFACESGHYFIVSFDGHKGNVNVDQNLLMEKLADFLNHETREGRLPVSLGFNYQLLGCIEKFFHQDG